MPGRGRKSKLGLRAERALICIIIINTRIILKILTSFSKSGKELHYYIVSRVLKKYRMNKRWPRKKPYLNSEYIIRKKDHCRAKKKI
jgi:hypothetical protein